MIIKLFTVYLTDTVIGFQAYVDENGNLLVLTDLSGRGEYLYSHIFNNGKIFKTVNNNNNENETFEINTGSVIGNVDAYFKFSIDILEKNVTLENIDGFTSLTEIKYEKTIYLLCIKDSTLTSDTSEKGLLFNEEVAIFRDNKYYIKKGNDSTSLEFKQSSLDEVMFLSDKQYPYAIHTVDSNSLNECRDKLLKAYKEFQAKQINFLQSQINVLREDIDSVCDSQLDSKKSELKVYGNIMRNNELESLEITDLKLPYPYDFVDECEFDIISLDLSESLMLFYKNDVEIKRVDLDKVSDNPFDINDYNKTVISLIHLFGMIDIDFKWKSYESKESTFEASTIRIKNSFEESDIDNMKDRDISKLYMSLSFLEN